MIRCRLKRYNFKIKNKMSKEIQNTDKVQNGNDFIADVSTSLSLDNFIINPKDKDDDFEIEIEGDFQGDAYAYLNKEQAIKLAKYILKSFNL
jgi:hypothetical protein